MTVQRAWDVPLIGGASGVGKTRVSYPLARHVGVGITEIDDFQIILERMITPEEHPVIHVFRTDPDAFHRQPPRRGGPPVVLEGDFLLPSLAVQPACDGVPAAGRVRAVIVYEEDEAQIGRNYLAREGEPQPARARASWRYSEWLRAEAARLGVPTLPARPWNTVLDRLLAFLAPADPPASRPSS